jgi:hypothetical protein
LNIARVPVLSSYSPLTSSPRHPSLSPLSASLPQGQAEQQLRAADATAAAEIARLTQELDRALAAKGAADVAARRDAAEAETMKRAVEGNARRIADLEGQVKGRG